MDLAEFIAARLSEDEQWAAVACSGERQPEWRADHADVFAVGGVRIAETRTASVAPHVARHDPARVLREVAAKRAILARHKPLQGVYGPCCAWCSDDVDAPRLNKPWPCEDVRDLVTVWSDHPDYSADWKP